MAKIPSTSEIRDTAGFAGGLTPELARLHILMADSVIDARNTSLAVGFRISPEQVAATPGLHVGRLVTVDRLVRDPEERLHLARQFQKDPFDGLG